MKKALIYLIFSLFIIAASSSLISLNEKDYEKQWSQIAKFEKDGLPKSAMIIVNQIYQTAKSEGNDPQVLKALIYRASLQSQFKEDHVLLTIQDFEKELQIAGSPEKQILHSIIAELYQWYFSSQQWKILKRGTVVDYDNKDVKTWDAKKFSEVIHDHFMASLKNAETTESIQLKSYRAILKNTGEQALILWPTLYDLLANRALLYYSSSDAELTNISGRTFRNDTFFERAQQFSDMDLKSDSTDAQFKILNLYQHLLNLHLKSNNVDAIVDLDLKRLGYVYRNSAASKKTDQTYIQSLTSLLSEYADHTSSVKISAKLAQRHTTAANKYKPLEGDDYRYELKKALEICNSAVKKFPKTPDVILCNNIVKEILKENHSLQMDAAVLPDKPFLAKLSFKNTTKLFFRAVKIDPQESLSTFYTDRHENASKYVKLPAAQSWSQNLPNTNDHQTHTAELKMPALDKGYYLIFTSNDSTFNAETDVVYQPLWVTGLSILSNNNTDNGTLNLHVLDRNSGYPVDGVTVTTYLLSWNSGKRENDLKNLGNFYTNSEGFAELTVANKIINGSLVYTVEKDGDFLSSNGRSSLYKRSKEAKVRTRTYFFTDRAIYRPGQTVYFKGIMVDRTGDEVQIKPNTKTEVTFYNANRKEVRTLELVSNEFGSIHGAFVIPTGGLNGSMRIKNKTGSLNFSVEEYKRPTFEISFDTIKETYKLGDEVTFTGKAENFAGSKLQYADVKFRVVQSPIMIPYFRFYQPYPIQKEVEIAHGLVPTDEDGIFSIQFPTEADEQKPGKGSYPQRFTVYVDVMDITGEVQSAQNYITIGQNPLVLAIESPEKMHKENNKGIQLSATNLSGASVDADVMLKVFRLTPPDQVLVNRNWSESDLKLIPEATFRSNFPNAIYNDEADKNQWRRLEVHSSSIQINGKASLLQDLFVDAKPGEYLIEASSVSESGDTSRVKKFVTLYSSESKHLPGKMISWSVVTKDKAEPGDVVQLIIGSAAKKTQIYYEIVNGEEIIDSNWISVSGSQKVIDIPVLEAYRGNFQIRASFVKYNRVFVESHLINVPFTNKKLDITIETHRDFLSPGKKEEWRVRITGPNGEKLASELLAGMYDASLDKFRSNEWGFGLYHAKRMKSNWTAGYFRPTNSQHLFYQQTDYETVKPTVYPEINWFNFRRFGYGSDLLMRGSTAGQPEIDGVKMDNAQADQKLSERTKEPENQEVEEPESQVVELKETAVPMRTNFNETAFFYPQLHTDSMGNIVFSFTTPDALTEWKLMMLAYSKELKIGSVVENFKAHKDLMIIPNLPRFVRQGDTLVFSAKVINFTDHDITATSSIEFFDAISMKTINIFTDSKTTSKTLSLKPGQSRLINWEICITEGYSMIGYRIKATTGDFTDGEERLLPVLTNRMLVTETLPMPIKGKQSKTFTFKKLVDAQNDGGNSTLSNYKLSLEFTSNPAWYAIQALPYLDAPKTENAGNLFRQYFANVLSSYIINIDPKIKNVVESWKSISPDAFMSNLQKNEELKNLVLNATPWVLEAEDEAEQKRRIAILFDVNRMANEKSNVIFKLQKSQLQSGAWSWFKGMREDRHTTQNIVVGLAKLSDKKVIDLGKETKVNRMLRKAVIYLDKEFVEDFEKLKKNKSNYLKSNQLGSTQIEYMYARTLLQEEFPIQQKVEEAFNYYLGQEKKYWLKKSNYLQGMIAITLYRSGNRNEAEGIMRSLKERALYNEEMGMYWRIESGWYWYQAPVETQAIIIDAYDQISNDAGAIEQMKIWLLKQKQTTNWKTSTATAEAVFALLLNGENLLSDDQLVNISVGGETIDVEEIDGVDVEPGTGYFKTSWSGKEIIPEMGNIQVENPNNGIAWGAAYWQYFEDLDKITAHDSPLSIEKIVFVEELTDEGPVIRPMDQHQSLKIGDKIVMRLIIRTDREMDYVHIKDMRATALEPINPISGYNYFGGLGFYKSVTDVSTEFFIRKLRKGTFVLEYPMMVTQLGDFSNGIATIQSYYAPEFAAHSEGLRIKVK